MEKALKHVYHACTNKLKLKELELVLVILPDNNGSLYGMPDVLSFLWLIHKLRLCDLLLGA